LHRRLDEWAIRRQCEYLDCTILRMVYKGTTATALFQSTGYTYTVYSLHVDSSQANCIAFAKANGITIPAALLTPYGVSLP